MYELYDRTLDFAVNDSKSNRKMSEADRILASVSVRGTSPTRYHDQKYEFRNKITNIVNGANDDDAMLLREELPAFIDYIKIGRYNRELIFETDVLPSLAVVLTSKEFNEEIISNAISAYTCICITCESAATLMIENGILDILASLVGESSVYDNEICLLCSAILLNTNCHEEFVEYSILENLIDRCHQSLSITGDISKEVSAAEEGVLELITILMDVFDNIAPELVFQYLELCRCALNAEHKFLLPKICSLLSVLVKKGSDYEDAVMTKGLVSYVSTFMTLEDWDYWGNVLSFLSDCIEFGNDEQKEKVFKYLKLNEIAAIVKWKPTGRVVASALKILTQVIEFEPSFLPQIPTEQVLRNVYDSLEDLSFAEKDETVRLLLQLIWIGDEDTVTMVLDSCIMNELITVLVDCEDSLKLFAMDVFGKLGTEGRIVFIDELQEVVDEWTTSENDDVRAKAIEFAECFM